MMYTILHSIIYIIYKGMHIEDGKKIESRQVCIYSLRGRRLLILDDNHK